jgi:hypothetical protein
MDTVDNECKPMQMVRVAQGGVNHNVAWPIFCQGDQDDKKNLPNAKREVEDAMSWPRQKYKGHWASLHWSTHSKHKLDRKA